MSERFLFEQEFDASGRVRASARNEVFDADELSAARAQAFAEGQEAGERAAQQSIEASAVTALGILTEDLRQLHANFTSAMSNQNKAAVGIAGTVGRLLAGRLMKDQPESEIEAMIADCLSRLNEEPRLVIRTSGPMAETLRERLDEIAGQVGFQGHLVLLPDDTLGDQDCLVEWADGGVSRDQAALEAEVDSAIQTFLASQPG